MPYFQDASEELRDLNKREKNIIALTVLGAFFTCFEFTIYFFFNEVITKAFFPDSIPGSLQAIGFTVLLVIGYISRPLGGIIMGDIGDRYGRRPVLLFSLFMVSISTILIGFLPTYAHVGMAAIISLMLLRFLQGIGFGAEVPASWVYLSEHMPRRHIGSACGMLLSVFVLATLLGNIFSTVLSAMLTPTQLLSYGWRIPFIFGGIGTLLAIALRFKMSETPIWINARNQNRLVPKFPLKDIFTKYRYGLLVTFGMSWFTSSVFLIAFLIIPSLGVKYFDIDSSLMDIANGIGIFFAAIGALVFGYCADRFNSGRVFTIACVMLALSSIMFFFNLKQGSDYILLAYAVFGFTAGIIGIVPSVCVRLFPVQVRMSGIALTYNVAYALTGVLTPLLLNYFSAQMSMSALLYMVFICVMGIIMGMFMTNLHGLYRMEDNRLTGSKMSSSS